jgi:hypothetical protein
VILHLFSPINLTHISVTFQSHFVHISFTFHLSFRHSLPSLHDLFMKTMASSPSCHCSTPQQSIEKSRAASLRMLDPCSFFRCLPFPSFVTSAEGFCLSKLEVVVLLMHYSQPIRCESDLKHCDNYRKGTWGTTSHSLVHIHSTSTRA